MPQAQTTFTCQLGARRLRKHYLKSIIAFYTTKPLYTEHVHYP